MESSMIFNASVSSANASRNRGSTSVSSFPRYESPRTRSPRLLTQAIDREYTRRFAPGENSRYCRLHETREYFHRAFRSPSPTAGLARPTPTTRPGFTTSFSQR